MLLPTTEILPEGETIDARPPLEALGSMLGGQVGALSAVRKAGPQILAAAGAMAQAISNNNSITYAAAGSSGLMALADACELPGTFGIPANLIQIHMAGGVPINGHMPGATEDDRKAAHQVAQRIRRGDVVIVVSASGTTPYAVEVADCAKLRGATVIGIANNRGSALLARADIAICLETPPEPVAGSTRLGAGTAQKVALNLMSTLMGVRLGHVYKGLMVNLVADNEKLTQRATRIVMQIADVTQPMAETALSQAEGHVKLAILLASDLSIQDATCLLAENGGHLAPCFEAIHSKDKQKSS